MNGLIINSDRLYLRPFTEKDLDNLYKLHSHRQVASTTIDGIQSLDQTKKHLHDFILHQNKNGYSQWAAFEKENNNFIGRAGLTKRKLCDETGEQVEVRYALLPEFWSKGYATELTVAIKKFAFEKLNLKKISASGNPTNKKSEAVLNKCNFLYIKNIIPEGYGRKEHITYWECNL